MAEQIVINLLFDRRPEKTSICKTTAPTDKT